MGFRTEPDEGGTDTGRCVGEFLSFCQLVLLLSYGYCVCACVCVCVCV
jgi:hypothetical protein